MEYFTVGDIANQGFYAVSEKLFNNKQYQKKVKKIKKVKEKGLMVPKEIITTEDLLTDTSKLMYGIMCRYLNYSLQNGWFDEKKRIFVKLSVSTLAEILNKSLDTIIKSKKQLESVGLLEIVKTKYQSDTFYLGKVKDKPQEDILMEIENRIKINLELESIEYSINSSEVLETIESGVLDNIEPIIVVPIRDNKRVVAEDLPAAPNGDFKKELKHLLENYKIADLNKNSLKNIIAYSNGNIEIIKKALGFMTTQKKSITLNILVAILRDRDFEKVQETGRDLTRDEKIIHMKNELGTEEVANLRQRVYETFNLGYDGEYIDIELGNILCRRYSKDVR